MSSSINRSISLSIYQSINQSINLSINLSIYQSINLSIYQSIYLSIYPSIHSFIHSFYLIMHSVFLIIHVYYIIYHLLYLFFFNPKSPKLPKTLEKRLVQVGPSVSGSVFTKCSAINSDACDAWLTAWLIVASPYVSSKSSSANQCCTWSFPIGASSHQRGEIGKIGEENCQDFDIRKCLVV